MKRLQIYIEDELDEALAQEAARQRTSKASLIRRFLAERMGGSEPSDPLAELIGRSDAAPCAVDDLVYGR